VFHIAFFAFFSKIYYAWSIYIYVCRMPGVKKSKKITSEALKQEILSQEEVREYQSERFSKIEDQVKK
jgi:hypothetical protein